MHAFTMPSILCLHCSPAGQFPHVEVNPYEPEVDWFTRDVEVMPFNAAPEPKRRFVPSKWEEKKCVTAVAVVGGQQSALGQAVWPTCVVVAEPRWLASIS
jgi:hypothetical protein